MELRDLRETDEAAIREALAAERWTEDQIEGQIAAVRALARSDAGVVVVADEADSFAGFVSAQFYGWNRLVQIHGLAVTSDKTRQGIGTRLLEAAEGFARGNVARGVYVDTPMNNEATRAFYNANGYSEAYRMPRYYSDEVDGVTFTKFFS